VHGLTHEALDAIAAEFDAIHRDVRRDLGGQDLAYIRRTVTIQRGLDASGRALLLAARLPFPMVVGTALLTVSKILENMEIGHGVVHGQWDWTGDPALRSSTYECDAVWTSMSWRRSHNYRHHTFTNVLGRDRDLVLSLRLLPEAPWKPVYLLQPIYVFGIGALFEWAIALHDMELDQLRDGTKAWSDVKPEIAAFARKASRQVAKDYLLFPLLSGRSAKRALQANLIANVARSLWVQTIVFCGHLPGGPETFTVEQFENESKGGAYVRQLTASRNIDGGPIFNVLTGHMGFQIEHHLFPGLPTNRYPEISERVQDICDRYRLPYATGSLRRQYGSVLTRIVRLAFPGPK
jgi:fatty acid desaturase